MATTNTNFISALGTGSGVDIKTLAQSLVDAEKVPKQKIIQDRIDKTELRVSGYSTVSFALDQLKGALEALKMPASFQAVSAASSQPAVVGISATGAVTTGSHEIEVSSLARAQRSVSAGFGSLTDSVRSDSTPMGAVDLLLTLNVYNGDPHSKYRIIVGRGSDASYEKMMNPKNLLFECEDYIDKEKTLGMVASMDGRLHFAIAPMENGSKAVSRVCEKSTLTLAAMSNKLHHRFSLKDFLEIAGAHIVEDSMDCDINLSPDKVTPSVFMDLMKTI